MAILGALLAPALAAQAATGALVIAGGAVREDTAAIPQALIAGRPAGARAIAIIPSASGAPAASAAHAAALLTQHGADAGDIRIIPLAMIDDPDTPDIDERRWAAHADDPATVALLADAGAIWFTGGDQMRTMALLAPGGRETRLLRAIRARQAAGAVIGGTSAGAAVMSRQMIAGGEPLPALVLAPRRLDGTAPVESAAGELLMADGLGFLADGLVDQHFDARRRLGRLARALFTLPPERRKGFGIDENTALRVSGDGRYGEVLGAGSVTLLDARGADAALTPALQAKGLRLSVAVPGDRIDLAAMTVEPGPGRAPPPPSDGEQALPRGRGGMAVAEPALAALLAEALADPASPALERPSVGDGQLLTYRFSRMPSTRALTGDAGTTIVDVRFDIRSTPLPRTAP